MRRTAFTTIELSVVILILALAAAAVTLRMQGPLRGAQKGDLVSSIVGFDRTTRAAARNLDKPLRLVVNLSAGTITRCDDSGRLTQGPGISLPAGYRFGRLMVGERDCHEGEVTISCSRRGLTPTYALLLESAGPPQWLVVAGLTGEITKVTSEADVRQILAATVVGHNAR